MPCGQENVGSVVEQKPGSRPDSRTGKDELVHQKRVGLVPG